MRVCFFLVAVLGMAFPVRAVAAELYVSYTRGSDANSGTEAAPFYSIQKAIDAAPESGCTIYVDEGTYLVTAGTSPTFLLTVTKPVKIIATGARDKTVIDAQLARKAVSMNNADALLSGFTVKNGYINAWDCAGLTLAAGTVSNCVFEAHKSHHATAAKVSGGLLTHSILRDGVVTGGSSSNQGAALSITGGTVNEVEVYGYRATYANGALCGIVYVKSGTLSDSIVHDNVIGTHREAGKGNDGRPEGLGYTGGGIVMDGTGAVVTGCRVINNVVHGYGSGVYLYNGLLENTLIAGNMASNYLFNAGGALYVKGGTVTDCTVTGNGAMRPTGGIEHRGGTIQNTIAFGNELADYYYENGTAEGLYTSGITFVDAVRGDYRLSAASENKTAGARFLRPEGNYGCSFSADKRTFAPGETASVTFTGAVVGNTSGTTYTWDFGDGTTLTGERVVSHTYALPGRYSVRLTVSDSDKGTTTSSARDFIDVRYGTVCISPTGTATPPYDTEAKALKNIHEALALNPDVILAYEGTYNLTEKPFFVTGPVMIKGVGDREKIVFDGYDKGKSRCMYMNDTGAKIENVTIYRGNYQGNWSHGGGVVLLDGVITNCVIKNCRNYLSAAIYMAGGRVDDCLITGNMCGANKDTSMVVGVYGGLFCNNIVTEQGVMGGTACRGIVHTFGDSAVVSNCFIYNNDVGGMTKEYHGAVSIAKGLVVNCVITNNIVSTYGGGVYMDGGTLRGCLVAGNSCNSGAASVGGGVYQLGGAIENCTIVNNTALISAGGLYQKSGSVVNSIIYGNSVDNIVSDGNGTITYSGSSPIPAGEGNVSSEPIFRDGKKGDYALTSFARDYVNQGTAQDWAVNARDLNGTTRISDGTIDIGAYEYAPSENEPFAAVFILTSGKTESTGSLDVSLKADVSKYAAADCTFVWDFGDGTDAVTVVGDPTVQHTYTAIGSFDIKLTVYPPAESGDGAAVFENKAMATVIPDTVYVSLKGNNTYPYISWETAANKLEDAIAVGTENVIVTSGVYKTTGTLVTHKAKIRSLFGPDETIIERESDTVTTPLVILQNDDSVFSGFTLRGASLNSWAEIDGGAGLRIVAGVATNCIVRDCQKYSYGNCYVGGTGKLFDSEIINNRSVANDAYGAGLCVAGSGTVSGCIITNNTGVQINNRAKGGAGLCLFGGTVTNCLIAGNIETKASSGAGGVYMNAGLLTHSIIKDNITYGSSGGIRQDGGIVRNCLITSNSSSGADSGDGVGGLWLTAGVAESLTIADNSSSLTGGGVRIAGGVFLNSIVNGNISSLECDISGGAISNCFSTVAMAGENCKAGDPLFTDNKNGDYTLQILSLARDAGLNQPWMEGGIDLAGNSRKQGAAVDIGAYEIDGNAAIPFSAAVSIIAQEKLSDGRTKFTFTATVLGNTGNVRYLWNFGDGYAEGEETMVYIFNPGAHTVSFKAQDETTEAFTDEIVREDYAIAMPDRCYVNADETVTPKYPYATKETAAKTIHDAILVYPKEIEVAPGLYQIDATINVTSDMIIYGETGRAGDVILKGSLSSSPSQIMILNSPNAVISSLTFKDGIMYNNTSVYTGSACYLLDGTITNCVVEGGKNYYNGAIVMKGGLLIDSVMRGTVGGHSVQTCYTLNIDGGIVDRCVITNNMMDAGYRKENKFGETGYAVQLNGDTAVMRNSLIADNIGGKGGGVNIIKAAEFSNNTVAGNDACWGTGGMKVTAVNAVVCNNIVAGNTGLLINDLDEVSANIFTYSCGPELSAKAGNIVGDPKFKTVKGNKYYLKNQSPCLDKGLYLEWMDGAKDLLGNPRIQNGHVGMGCYEVPYSGFIIILR